MLFRLNALLLAAVIALAPLAETALASQNQLYSPTTGTVSGLSLTNYLNGAIDSVNTLNSGASAPANQLSGVPSAGNGWLNTTASPYPWNLYDGASWVPTGALDTVNHIWDAQVGGGTNSVASATTTDLCSVPQYFLTVTGTTTITGFGSTCKAGVQKLITFAGALTLTYNSGSMIVPGSANITTSSGDVAIALALGSGNWQIVSYFPATGTALVNPAVDVGAILYFSGGAPPSAKYLEGYGQAISRTTYATYMGVITNTQSVTRTSGSAVLTGFSDTTRFNAGQPIEGSGIPSGATVGSTTSTTVTMASTCSGGSGACNAISSGTGNVTVFYYGNGDGSTTFNMPNCAGQLLVGRNNMGGTAQSFLTSTYALNNPNAMGVSLGKQNHTQTLGELVAHNHSITDPGHVHQWTNEFPPGSGSGGLSGGGTPGTITWAPTATNTTSATTGITINNAGSGNPFTVVNPMLTVECMVRVLP